MKQTSLILLIFVMLMTSCAYNKYEEDDVDMYLDWSGYWYYQGEETWDAYNRSRLLAERVLNEDPENLMAKLIYGYSLMKLRVWESDNPRMNTSKKIFNEIIEIEPNNYRAHLGLGITYIKLCKKYTGKLRDFQRLISDSEFLMDEKEKIDKMKAEEKDFSNQELQLVSDTNVWFDKIKLVVKGEIFPYMEYVSLSKEQNPTLADVQEALGERIDALLKSIDEAMMDFPFNYSAYIENIKKLKLLFEIAEKYYKKEYVNLIDDAEKEFNFCLQLHEEYERVYFWVFDYLSILYAIKATLVEGNQQLELEYHELERDYLTKFIIEDEKFERKRRKKLTSDEIVELQNNPFFSTVSENYQDLMIRLIDSSRAVRQNKIITLISLIANVFKDYVKALEWVEELKKTEERLSNPESIEPYLYYYFRVKVYMLKSQEMENKYPGLEKLALLSDADRDKIPAQFVDEHKLVWEQIIDNSSKFMKKSSIARNDIEREEMDSVLLDALKRYPDLYQKYDE